MEIGVDSFAAIVPRATPADAAEQLANMLQEIEIADRTGLVAFGAVSTSAPNFSLERQPSSLPPLRCVPKRYGWQPLS